MSEAIGSASSVVEFDPRARLSKWANENDEWIRLIVAEVLLSGRALEADALDRVYQLFREEKSLDDRTLPETALLNTEANLDETAPPLTLTRLSDVHGINALVSTSAIEPHEGLTILYGENGTGKTGYSRIFKALAASRTAVQILGDINSATEEAQSAKLEYLLGDEQKSFEWDGQRGVAPFTRMSIFDSSAVSTHVDEDLDYVYVPAVLALYNHVTAAIQAIASRIDQSIAALTVVDGSLLSRFPKESTLYPLIETLGASTDLPGLKEKRPVGPDIDKTLEALGQSVAALKSNAIGAQLTVKRRELRVLEEAVAIGKSVAAFDRDGFNAAVENHAQLTRDYEAFRTELFAAAGLPAEPDETWHGFVAAGDAYRSHLVSIDAHDSARCLYCRQTLAEPARALLSKYSKYLDDKIRTDLRAAEARVKAAQQVAADIPHADVSAFVAEVEDGDAKPSFFEQVCGLETTRAALVQRVNEWTHVPAYKAATDDLTRALSEVAADLALRVASLEEQSKDQKGALAEKQQELWELTASVELAKSWSAIERQVTDAKTADQLRKLKRPLSGLVRGVTGQAKAASDQLVNQSFDSFFAEECEALRAPALKVQFVGRAGKAHRRKILNGSHKPSRVFSEGEQKVLALADFLAEARLSGITAPVIFDDPVSSLDHRRLREVATRISKLSETNQVIVFTHDIWLASTLLALSEESKRCSYFQITDEDGKGKVTRATGPRWDTLGGIKSKINTTIEAAKTSEGETRDALVRTGYDWIRSWCEVFTELELLRGVTQRYQPNVGMTKLANINTEKLGTIIPVVTRVFDDACRYIDGHSQPLVTLGVSPTLSSLESDWAILQQLKKSNDS